MRESSAPCYFVKLCHTHKKEIGIGVLLCVKQLRKDSLNGQCHGGLFESSSSLEVAISCYIINRKYILLLSFFPEEFCHLPLLLSILKLWIFLFQFETFSDVDSLLEISPAKKQIEITFWQLDFLSPFWIDFEGTFLLRTWRQNW